MKPDSGDVEVVIAAGEQPAAPGEETSLLRAPSDLLRWFGLLPQRKGSNLREKIAREIAKETSYTWTEVEEPETAEATAAAVVSKAMETVEAVEAVETVETVEAAEAAAAVVAKEAEERAAAEAAVAAKEAEAKAAAEVAVAAKAMEAVEAVAAVETVAAVEAVEAGDAAVAALTARIFANVREGDETAGAAHLSTPSPAQAAQAPQTPEAMLEEAETAATVMQKMVRGQSSRRQPDPKHGAAESTQAPLRDSSRGESVPQQGGDRVAVLRTLFGALELELEAELAAELNISRWEPLQALAAERLDVRQYARQTLRRMHELALEPHAPHDQAPLTPGVSGLALTTRSSHGLADVSGLADDATLLRALHGALAAKRAIAGWPDGLPRLLTAAQCDDCASLLTAPRLALCGGRLGPEGAGALGVLLQASTVLGDVEADECAMGGVGLVALSQAVRAAAVLTELNVARNGADEPAADELRAAVRALEARTKVAVRLEGDRSQGPVISPAELGNVSAGARHGSNHKRIEMPVSLPGPAPARRSSSELWGAPGLSAASPRVRVSVSTGSAAPPPPPYAPPPQPMVKEEGSSSRSSWGALNIKRVHRSLSLKRRALTVQKKPSGRALVNESHKWSMAPQIVPLRRLNLFAAKDKGAHDPAALLRLFIEAPDCRISSHVERMSELVAWLQSVAELPSATPAGNGHSRASTRRRSSTKAMGAELYAPLGRSCEVLLALHRVLRPRLTLDKHRRLLSVLHARCDASARFWNKGALGEPNGALRVLVAGGGPVGLRAAIEMALLGHQVTLSPRGERRGVHMHMHMHMLMHMHIPRDMICVAPRVTPRVTPGDGLRRARRVPPAQRAQDVGRDHWGPREARAELRRPRFLQRARPARVDLEIAARAAQDGAAARGRGQGGGDGRQPRRA